MRVWVWSRVWGAVWVYSGQWVLTWSCLEDAGVGGALTSRTPHVSNAGLGFQYSLPAHPCQDGAGWALLGMMLRERVVETDDEGVVTFSDRAGPARVSAADALRHRFMSQVCQAHGAVWRVIRVQHRRWVLIDPPCILTPLRVLGRVVLSLRSPQARRPGTASVAEAAATAAAASGAAKLSGSRGTSSAPTSVPSSSVDPYAAAAAAGAAASRDVGASKAGAFGRAVGRVGVDGRIGVTV